MDANAGFVRCDVPREGGALAVDVAGRGPLVLLVPGMGELRSSYRHMVGGLVRAGFRVAVMDLRGHGESSTCFTSYDDAATGDDILAVINAMDSGPAVIVGNSMGAAAAVLAASRRPETVSALVLIGPFVRDGGNLLLRALMRLALLPPWGPAVWRRYHASLFGAVVEPDHPEHLARVSAALSRPGYFRAFRATASGSHAQAQSALRAVRAPVMVVMGDKDPDFPDPGAEARWVADSVGGQVVMVSGAGHYPMAEQPEVVLRAVLPFLGEAVGGGGRGGSALA